MQVTFGNNSDMLPKLANSREAARDFIANRKLIHCNTVIVIVVNSLIIATSLIIIL